MTWIDVASVESLTPGKCRTVEVQGRRFTLLNVGGEFHALGDRCPHRGVPLGAGYLDGTKLYCPLHGWEFDARTGACASRPDQPVESYPVLVENGRVRVLA